MRPRFQRDWEQFHSANVFLPHQNKINKDTTGDCLSVLYHVIASVRAIYREIIIGKLYLYLLDIMCPQHQIMDTCTLGQSLSSFPIYFFFSVSAIWPSFKAVVWSCYALKFGSFSGPHLVPFLAYSMLDLEWKKMPSANINDSCWLRYSGIHWLIFKWEPLLSIWF